MTPATTGRFDLFLMIPRSVCATALVVAAALMLVGCGSQSPRLATPRVWVTHPHSESVGACASTNCGDHQAALNWTISFPGTTAYNVLLNGSRVADVSRSPYTFTGMRCGTTYTLGVQAHNRSGGTSTTYATPYTTAACRSYSPFPLRISANGRFLEDSSGVPWLMVGDSPWTAIGNADQAHWDSYLADRESLGFNTVLLSALCDANLPCSSGGAHTEAFDGTKPFTSGTNQSSYNLLDPNSSYWSQLHAMVADAQSDGIAVLLDPLEVSSCSSNSWFPALAAGGDGTVSTTDDDYKFGQFLGTEFADLDNVIWMMGNDFTCYTTSADDADLLSVANGIEATDAGSPMTLEVCSPAMCRGGGNAEEGFSSFDDTTHNWTKDLDLNLAYTYAPTYAMDAHAYAQSPTSPMFMGEANYEGSSLGGTDGGSTRILRLQEWWTMTSGATGQTYGGPSYPFSNNTTLGDIDTTGVSQLSAQTKFLSSIDWWNLRPDTAKDVVTSGSGSCPSTGSMVSVTCVTTASDYDGSPGSATLSLSYLPDPGSFSSPVVDLADFAGRVQARWVDPTNGNETTIGTFSPSGSHTFTPSADNSAGDKDWVLLLTTSVTRTAPHGSRLSP